jgi:endo-1,4-beta-xylanase
LRDCLFLRTIGSAYLPIVFAAAAKADPGAKFYLNEFGIENDYGVARNMEDEYIEKPTHKREKRDAQSQTSLGSFGVHSCKECGRRKIEATKEVVRLIRGYGAPIHGIGFQSHFEYNNTPSSTILSRIMKEFTDLDLDVAVTELDIRMDLSNMRVEVQEEQARGFVGVVTACRDVDRCKGVTLWEFRDFKGGVSIFSRSLLLYSREARTVEHFFIDCDRDGRLICYSFCDYEGMG